MMKNIGEWLYGTEKWFLIYLTKINLKNKTMFTFTVFITILTSLCWIELKKQGKTEIFKYDPTPLAMFALIGSIISFILISIICFLYLPWFMKKRITQKQRIKRIVKEALAQTYGKAGYTSTADKFYKLICKKLIWLKDLVHYLFADTT